MKNDQILLDVTSSAFIGDTGYGNLLECRKACKEHGFTFGIQLHNSATSEEIERIVGFGVPMSAHAPLLSEYAVNLAAEDAGLSLIELRRNAEIMRRHKMTRAVFHGFMMTDLPVPAFGRGRSYDECLGLIFRPEMSIDGKSRICGDFLDTEEYAIRRERVKQRLELVRHEFPDLLFCIENDFPAYGSANLFAGDSAASFGHPACLDACHLWTAAFIYDRDFHHEALEFLNRCDVQMVHLHASPFTPGTPKTEWGDGHQPLSIPNLQDLPRFVRNCRDAGARHFVLEIIKATPDDIHAFAGMWDS
ncbi:MAG: hypothetical protein WCS96_08910 [Victivallales bacterium]|jgi:hypothetical protein